MELTKTFRQDKNGNTESELNIVVEFDTDTDTVTEIKSIWAWNYEKQIATDLTSIFAGDLSIELDRIIDGIDWLEVYAEKYASA